MYSQVQIVSDSQLESLTCLSTRWRLNAIRMLASTVPLSNDPSFMGGKFGFQLPPEEVDFDFLLCGAFRFVSSELADFLQGRVNAEFLSVELAYSSNQKQFCLMHMCERRNAIDRSLSDFTERAEDQGGGISEIRKLVLLNDSLEDVKGFILNETGMLFFEDQLCREILEGGFRGLQFCPSDLVTFGC